MTVAWLDTIGALAGAHVAAVRERWAARGHPTTVHDVVDEIVNTEYPVEWPEPLTAAASAARIALAADVRWQRLTDALGVTDLEAEWLALLVACALNPRLNRVLGYLDDAAVPAPPTPSLGALFWNWPVGYQPGPGSALARWQVAWPAAEPAVAWHSSSPWVVDVDMAAFLAGYGPWRQLRNDLSMPDASRFECIYPGLLQEICEAVTAVTAMGCEVELVGRPGSGRRTLLTQVAVALGRTPAVVSPADGLRALRAARLLNAVPIWIDDGEAPVGADAAPGGLTLVVRQAPATTTPDGVIRLGWTMPETRRLQRQRLWSGRSIAPPPRLVQEWDLTPADITAGAAASAAGPALASRVMRDRLRAGTRASLTMLDCPYEWEDLIVAAHVGEQLQQLRAQVLLNQDVLDGWEFRRLVPTASGVTALFAGPSGTGKSMAAQVLARSLELELFRVDLAEVVNKYIGETEKRLALVFAECERSNVMVLFDEADALFGQRTRVQDAHDRYANIEIDYLLQRLDTFRGVAILATNRKSDLDSAFLRRLRTVIDFVAPARPERLRLWRQALPERTSGGERITDALDHEWLASHIELTGAEIKAAALAAAFEARSAGGLITTERVLKAIRRELTKRGASVRIEAVPEPQVAVIR